MAGKLSVHFLPTLTSERELSGGDVVVIDVLRASTTIVTALAAGANEVRACQEVDEARKLAAELKNESVVLGGERKGGKIEGFDLGNSPSEYTPATVGGRTLIFTTTNGTRAMKTAREANRVWIGAFVNLLAVCRQLTGEQPIHLLCAGTDGKITREDVLCAGAMVDRLTSRTPELTLNDQAYIARDAWKNTAGQPLAETLRDTQGGRNLTGMGLQADIVAAAHIDHYDVVPVLDTTTGRIT